MRTVSVSVVIPSYNCGRFVVQAVESVLAQTVPPSEIIIVDDGSTDDTREQLVSYERHVRYVYQANQGVSAARNHGVRQAQEEFVAFLDADDVWHPRKLERQTAVFRAKPELALLGTASFDWPAAEFPNVESDAGRVHAVSWQQLAVKNRLNTSSIVVRRAVLQQAGPFDTRMQGPEDRDLWLRIGRIAPMANLDLLLTGYRHVVGSVCRQAARCEAGMRLILRKMDERGDFKGRRLLRCKAFSYLNHACSLIYDETEQHGHAVRRELASLAWYPLPFGVGEARIALERPRRLLVALLRLLRLKAAPAPRPSSLGEGTADALQRLKARRRESCVPRG